MVIWIYIDHHNIITLGFMLLLKFYVFCETICENSQVGYKIVEK